MPRAMGMRTAFVRVHTSCHPARPSTPQRRANLSAHSLCSLPADDASPLTLPLSTTTACNRISLLLSSSTAINIAPCPPLRRTSGVLAGHLVGYFDCAGMGYLLTVAQVSRREKVIVMAQSWCVTAAEDQSSQMLIFYVRFP